VLCIQQEKSSLLNNTWCRQLKTNLYCYHSDLPEDGQTNRKIYSF
jgi:hypothetical protein